MTAALNDPTVVIVHGLWMTGVESFLLQRHIQAQTGWRTTRFSYRSVTDPLADITAGLGEFIEALPAGPVHIVAHSLGGLITHELVHNYGFDRSGRVVLLCSPIQGSAAARGLARLPLGRRMLGQSVCDGLLEPATRSWQSDIQAGVLAGTRSMGLGRVISRVARPNDGTVALAETRLPGAADQIALPVSHSSVLFSPEAAAQATFFLVHGRFRR